MMLECEIMENMDNFDDLLCQVENLDQNSLFADVSKITDNYASLQLLKLAEVDPCYNSFDSYTTLSSHPPEQQDTDIDSSSKICSPTFLSQHNNSSDDDETELMSTDTIALSQSGEEKTFKGNNNSLSILSCANMLSPPSSSDGGDDVESLFPELIDIENQVVRAARTSYESIDDDVSVRNVIKVNVSRVSPASKNTTVSDGKSGTAFHNNVHNYAAPSNRASYNNKLGRPPKYAELEPPCGYSECGPMSKNAVLARENRKKKKEYMSQLESEITELKGDNEGLTTKLSQANNTIKSLHDEIQYLKSVIANESTLGALLKNIPAATNITLKRGRQNNTWDNPSAESKRRKLDHDYLSLIDGVDASSRPGVCLHVAEGSVSLEFCSRCNLQSQNSNTQ